MTEHVIKIIGNYSYHSTHCLGEGVYGKVFQGIEKETKEKVAIKKINLNIFSNDKYLENAIFSEIHLLKRFNHPNIVKFKDVLSSKNSLYIITEYCRGGDLKELIMKKKQFNQQEAFQVIKQILCGFTQLVQEKIVHRDLKPANILINDQTYKIADFGFAKCVENFGSQMLKSCVGSPIYMAPQILQRSQYTTKCDIWSIGIIFYEMLRGSPPFKAHDENQLLKNLKKTSIEQVLKKQKFSQKASDFLRRCLAYKQEERSSWPELFQIYLYNNKPFQIQTKQQSAQNQNIQNSQRNRIGNPQSIKIQNPVDYAKKQQSNQTHIIQNNIINTINNNANIITQAQTRQNSISNRSNSHSSVTSIQQNSNSNFVNKNTRIVNNISSLESIKNYRDECVYKYFVCVEFYLYLEIFQAIFLNDQSYLHMIYLLISNIKIQSHFALSLLTLLIRVNPTYENLKKIMQKQNEAYLQFFNDLDVYLQKYNNLKSIRQETESLIGLKTEIINEEKIEKIEEILHNSIIKNTKFLLKAIQSNINYQKDYHIIQILDWSFDIISLTKKKDKNKTELSKYNSLQSIENLSEYSKRVMEKVQNLLQKIQV